MKTFAPRPGRAVSFAVHSFDEAEALRRLVLSSLPLSRMFSEWVIVDHRSGDHTQTVIEDLRPILAEHGIALCTLSEHRDLSAAFTFADLRNLTIKACSHPVVAIHDADFILGPRFAAVLRRAVIGLGAPRSRSYGAAYAVPCVWDSLRTDSSGRITDHGRVWVHKCRPRVLWRDAVHYAQTKQGGRWERLMVDDPVRTERLNLTPPSRRTALLPDALVSCNVKPPSRIALRDTMTMFMQDAVQGRVSGGWLENYREGRVRSQGAYDYHRCSVRGWTLHAPGLELAA